MALEIGGKGNVSRHVQTRMHIGIRDSHTGQPQQIPHFSKAQLMGQRVGHPGRRTSIIGSRGIIKPNPIPAFPSHLRQTLGRCHESRRFHRPRRPFRSLG
eukprot:scaffold42226_cov45-Attheya_sp.AAC.2